MPFSREREKISSFLNCKNSRKPGIFFYSGTVELNNTDVKIQCKQKHAIQVPGVRQAEAHNSILYYMSLV